MEAGSEALDAGVLQYAKSFTVGQGGFVEYGGRRLNIENVQPIKGPEELAKVPVAKRGGRVLRMADLGRVVQDHQQLWGEGVVNGGPGLLLIVQKYRGANTVEVTKGVDTALTQLKAGLPGVDVDSTDLPPGDVHRAVDRQPQQGAADRRAARDRDHHGVPLRVPHGVHQPHRDPAVAARRGARARPARHDDQRHGPRGAGGRDRGGGRRRDHRRGEHRQAIAPVARRGQPRSRRSGSCSTPRSRSARRSRTRRSSTSSRSCRCCF